MLENTCFSKSLKKTDPVFTTQLLPTPASKNLSNCKMMSTKFYALKGVKFTMQNQTQIH